MGLRWGRPGTSGMFRSPDSNSSPDLFYSCAWQVQASRVRIGFPGPGPPFGSQRALPRREERKRRRRRHFSQRTRQRTCQRILQHTNRRFHHRARQHTHHRSHRPRSPRLCLPHRRPLHRVLSRVRAQKGTPLHGQLLFSADCTSDTHCTHTYTHA